MLRVSSYRRLFEEEQWGGLRLGGQLVSSDRGGAAEFQWEEPDFSAARALNREGASQFRRERILIAELNDRLALLIDAARCLEEDNECLEAQILAMEGRLSRQGARVSVQVPGWGLEMVVERLRREKEQILCDIAQLKKERDLLQAQCDEASEQRSLIYLEKEDIALDVDEVTADCLALRDQATIYEEQLAAMQAEHERRVECMAEPDEPAAAVAVVTLGFPSPDVSSAILDIKERFCQLSRSLQFQPKAKAAVAVGAIAVAERREGERVVARSAEASTVPELKAQIADLQRELAELEMYGEELDDRIMQRRATYLEEIEELECCVAELEAAQAELEAQMRDQCGDYQDLLGQKMARDIEIIYYRGLVEEEEERLCFL
ncbi:hypothetical protein AAFF_G00377370 [Aldrovandia affinis]|uniref:IF rod domain-containing protein n=1 Tax=Aldrovandia affinis TaxID=143900 RepID=A0AAD7SHW5_9TELE|nr:hypothetical protein AAFF_G00377370 [Aldrovandia affinis]